MSFEIRNLFQPDYLIRFQLILQGGFAQVFLSTNISTKEKYALKIVAKSSLVKPRARLKVLIFESYNFHRVLLIHISLCSFKLRLKSTEP
jgi:serine/threonine protein kinase